VGVGRSGETQHANSSVLESDNPLESTLLLLDRAISAPFRLFGSLVEPLRDEIGRGVRRSFGVAERPAPREQDPGLAYMAPGSVVRIVHSDLPSMMIGGLSALLLQALHPLAMAGVAEHSDYQQDTLRRFRRTAQFVAVTTFGTVDEARAAIAHVQILHRHVHGIAPDGRPYSASDPDLLTWIHAAEVYSFLEASRRYGPVRLTRADCDSYYRQSAKVAFELGAEWVPRSTDETKAYFQRVRKELCAGPQALAARDFLLHGVTRKPEDRAVYRLLIRAAISTLPQFAREELGFRGLSSLERTTLQSATRILCGAVRWAVPPRA
jgi:uncharacterized protein (DUF2236 family)